MFEGSQDIEADVVRILVALRAVGPNGASFPTTIVQASSGEDLCLAPIVFTEMRWTLLKSYPCTMAFSDFSVAFTVLFTCPSTRTW